jgi:hypothetical protein
MDPALVFIAAFNLLVAASSTALFAERRHPVFAGSAVIAFGAYLMVLAKAAA